MLGIDFILNWIDGDNPVSAITGVLLYFGVPDGAIDDLSSSRLAGILVLDNPATALKSGLLVRCRCQDQHFQILQLRWNTDSKDTPWRFMRKAP